jgi:methionine synthase II (cobalamin-independent)
MNQDNKRAPFRAEHVGSFPRPDRLLKARQDYSEGQISKEEQQHSGRLHTRDCRLTGARWGRRSNGW